MLNLSSKRVLSIVLIVAIALVGLVMVLVSCEKQTQTLHEQSVLLAATEDRETPAAWPTLTAHPGGAVIEWAPTGYITKAYTSTLDAPDWQLYVDLQLRLDGSVLASKTIGTGIRPPTAPLTSGVFAALVWHWEAETLRELPAQNLEEWARLRWSAPGSGESDVYDRYVGDNNETIPEDEEGYTPRRFVRGTGHWLYLPIISKRRPF